MAFTPIPENTEPWFQQANDAWTNQDARITDTETVNGQQWNDITINRNNVAKLRASTSQPEDYGLLSWTFDPATAGASVVPASGSIIMIKQWVSIGTVTSLGVMANAAGVGLVANQSFMGLYDQAGTLVGQTADLSTTFASIGYKQNALTSPVSVATAGFYYVALVCNGATAVGITRGSNTNVALVNMNLSVAESRFATAGTGTVLPASITMSTRTPTSQTYWITVA